MIVAVLGARGFVGSAIAGAVRARGFDVVELPRLPLEVADAVLSGRVPLGATAILRPMDGADAVVNAAGLAAPDLRNEPALRASNATLPLALALLASRSGVRRFVQVSSAAVQGRRSPLDETSTTDPISAYSESKAEGERRLLAAGAIPDLVIYRPTSVLGPDRAIARKLVRLAGARLVPLVGDGSLRLPVSLVSNVGALAVHLAMTTQVRGIVLHPWEGLTQRALMEALAPAAPRFVGVPTAAARVVAGAGSSLPVLRGQVRRIELLLCGQEIEARAAADSGYKLPSDLLARYMALGAAVRARAGVAT